MRSSEILLLLLGGALTLRTPAQHLVRDISPRGASSSPKSPAAVGGTLFFGSANGVNGNELWKSDGSAAGTALVADIRQGPAHSDPVHFTAVGGVFLFFSANDGVNGRELWKSDVAGTVMVRDIHAGPLSAAPASLVASGSRLFFTADDGRSGRELWQSVPPWTPGTTSMVLDIGAAGASGLQLGENRLLSAADNVRILMAGSGASGDEPWRSDGTTTGTSMPADIWPEPAGSDRALFTRAGNTVFFSANDGVKGRELWAMAPRCHRRCTGRAVRSRMRGLRGTCPADLRSRRAGERPSRLRGAGLAGAAQRARDPLHAPGAGCALGRRRLRLPPRPAGPLPRPRGKLGNAFDAYVHKVADTIPRILARLPKCQPCDPQAVSAAFLRLAEPPPTSHGPTPGGAPTPDSIQ